jgi:hypothetical protein
MEESFGSDYNMIIEEYSFYQKLTPKMQNALIKSIFSAFHKKFAKSLFKSCEQSFVSDITINLYSRSFPAEITTVMEEGNKFSEMFLIHKGSISIHFGQGTPPILVLPESSHFGDY